MILKIILSFLIVGVLGGLLGLGLAYAFERLKVKTDKRVDELLEVLPGLNCGACGYAGCSGYAEALVKEEESVLTKCSPGGAEAAQGIGELLGQSVELPARKMVAFVHCGGSRDKANKVFEFSGLDDCNARSIYFGGEKECKYGCLGGGSCVKVCPVNAISYTGNGLVKVDKDKCISCGKCVSVCPTGVMKMIPYDADYIVACNSKDKGAKVRKYCSVGCIGCKICTKKSPDGGFVVEDFLASIDYSKTGSREEAAEACPAKCITRISEALPAVANKGKIEDKKVENEEV